MTIPSHPSGVVKTKPLASVNGTTTCGTNINIDALKTTEDDVEDSFMGSPTLVDTRPLPFSGTHTIPGLSPVQSHPSHALLDACRKRDIDRARELLKNGVNMNYSVGGNTALHIVSAVGCSEMVKLLLSHPELRINARNSKKETALMIASSRGHLGIVQALIERSVNDSLDLSARGALRCALAAKHEEVAKFLLHQPGLDPNINTRQGKTPLMLAANDGKGHLLRLLLAHPRIDVNIKNEKDTNATALTYAVMSNHTEIIEQMLCHRDIDVNAVLNTGMTPLMLASTKGLTEIVRLLLNHSSIDVNVKNTKDAGATALMYACLSGHKDVVCLLLEQNELEVFATTRGPLYNITALDLASSCERWEISELLREHDRTGLGSIVSKV